MTEFEEAQDMARSDSKFRAFLRKARDPVTLQEMLEDEYDLSLSFEEACDLMDEVLV